ncbi:chromosome segregation and condensation protein ScpA [Weissella oryzae SG25]|uniref:Segregation and condensation protein B n=1 Tax=Weissella oryzae (strain DSM 25784 / JCM 18191 / LMG 30913 / SG25) TaxID=1329250 RepID=A0A069CZB9_WEIOS|nr:SMC-Scp complex subunit ScpB [Weissella oryzae]GAK30416.1 chromosome segregation and condensation protein ScpA [Weissella oryzae SG25]
MNSMQQIEGLLFVAGEEGISIAEIAAATGFERPAILALINELAERYVQDDNSALAIMQTEDNYQLVTKAELAAVIHEYFTAPLTTALSQASLEVLAIVAYRQPITRVEIDEIRGVQSQGTLQKLVLRNLIESRQRSTEPGRPNLYETTDYFLNYFGLVNLKELPPLVDAEILENLKSQKDQTVPLMPALSSDFELTEDLD